MSATRKQETIWTALSRQQRTATAVAATRLQPKRVAAAASDAYVHDDHLAVITVAKKKKRRTLDNAMDGNGDADAAVLTDGEIFSSQEDIEHRDADVCVFQAACSSASVAATPDTESRSEREREHDGVVTVDVRLNQHVVTPEKRAPIRSSEHSSAVESVSMPRSIDMPLHRNKTIKDDVHGLVEFEPICMRIIDTLQFQRLRSLHQLGAAHFVYIGATHSRFEHCLGVAYLAERLVKNISEHQPWLAISHTDVLCVKIAGLCHDLGHGPFSHVFDGIFMKTLRARGLVAESFRWTHEQGSLDMLDHLLCANAIDVSKYGLSAQDVAFIKELIFGGPLPGSDGVLHGRPTKRFLYDIVNNAQSGLDVDKLDYFLRDAVHAGVQSACDAQLLLQSARVLPDHCTHRLTVCFPEKLACQVMRAFHTRFELHQSVYQHKSVRAIEYMICDVLLAANDHMRIKGSRVSDIVANMDAYQHLDDRVLARIQESDATELADARRILLRIATKPYYQYVGKTLVTDHSRGKSEATLKHEILGCAPSESQSLVAESDNVIVEFLRIHCGKGEDDPLRHVRFYTKNASADAMCYAIPPEAYAMHSPKTFQELSIRVFVKQPRLMAPVRKAFERWSVQVNYSLVTPIAAP